MWTELKSIDEQRKQYKEKARKSVKEDKEARVWHKRMEERIEIRRAEIAMKMVEAAGEADIDNFGDKPIHDEGHRLQIAEVEPEEPYIVQDPDATSYV